MKQLTQEFKEAYCALYWEQEVVKVVGKDNLVTLLQYRSVLYSWGDDKNGFQHIQLRPVESITDEEMQEFYLLEGGSFEELNYEHTYYHDTVDYLRSIGIATPFRGVTVEQMVEDGFLKLQA